MPKISLFLKPVDSAKQGEAGQELPTMSEERWSDLAMLSIESVSKSLTFQNYDGHFCANERFRILRLLWTTVYICKYRLTVRLVSFGYLIYAV